MLAETGGAELLTVLVDPFGLRVGAKQWTGTPDGPPVLAGYVGKEEKAGFLFNVEQLPVAGIGDLADACDRLNTQRDRFPIRGKPITKERKRVYRRSIPRPGEPATFADAPSRVLFLDIDGDGALSEPAHIELARDPVGYAEEVWRELGELIPALAGAAAWWGYSSSAGRTPGVNMRFAVWLEEPLTCEQLKQWGALINQPFGKKPLLDTSIFQAVQATYVARPAFVNLADPVPVRCGRIKGAPSVLIVPPTPVALRDAQRAAREAEGTGAIVRATGKGSARYVQSIGGRGGFHKMMVAAFTAGIERGENPDDIKAAVRARIQECADQRDPATIARYLSDAELNGIIQWARIKAANNIEQRCAMAQPHPGIAGLVPVPEARQRLREALHRWGKAAVAFLEMHALVPDNVQPKPPRLFANVGVGLGKTEAAIELVRELLKPGGLVQRITYLVPTHKLGAELVKRFAKFGIVAQIWYGVTAKDENGNPLVCKQPELRDAAMAVPGGLKQACTRCPSFASCAYQAQRAAKPQVWIAAHEHLFLKPATALRSSQALIVDEGFWPKGLNGTDGKLAQLLLSTLQSRVDPLEGQQRADLETNRAWLLQALSTIPEGGRLTGDALLRAGITEERCGAGYALEWERKPDLAEALQGCEGQPEAMIRVLKAYKAWNFSPLVPRLWLQAAALVRGETVQVVRREVKVGDAGHGPGVGMTWREDIHETWTAMPALLLDATGQRAIVERYFGPVETIEIQAQLPDAVRVTQVYETKGALNAFVRKEFLPDDGDDGSRDANLNRIARWIKFEAAQKRSDGTPRQIAVICQLAIEKRLAQPDCPKNVRFAHFGAIEGRDDLGDVDVLLVLGRTQPNPETIERVAAALFSRDIETIGGGRYPTAAVRLHGTDLIVDTDRHPDPHAEAVRVAIAEAGIVQAIGRGRAVKRTAADPLRIVIVGSTPVPTLAPHELVPWSEFAPDRFELSVAKYGVLPLNPKAMVATGFWRTPEAARKALYRARGAKGGPNLGHPPINSTYRDLSQVKVLYRYRDTPSTKHWDEVGGPADPIEARRLLETLLGRAVAQWEGLQEAPAAAPDVVLSASATLPEGITHPLRAHEDGSVDPPTPVQWTVHALRGLAVATSTGRATVNVEVALQGIAVSCIAGILSPHTIAASGDPPSPTETIERLAGMLGVGRHPLRRMVRTLQQAPPEGLLLPAHLIEVEALIELRGYVAVMQALQALAPEPPQETIQEDAKHG